MLASLKVELAKINFSPPKLLNLVVLRTDQSFSADEVLAAAGVNVSSF